MRKIDIVRPPINYAVITKTFKYQIAWFVDVDDATDFVNSQFNRENYEILEARR